MSKRTEVRIRVSVGHSGRWGVTLLAALTLAASVAQAAVVAKYTFDGRAPRGSRSVRLHSARYPYSGEPYVPRPEAGETGPSLENPGPGGDNWNYYRSLYNHAAGPEADGRQVLELTNRHGHYHDYYRTPAEAGPLPAEGSFTWEIVVRVDDYSGADHYGVLIDASRGAGRIPNWPGEAVVTRLWMGARIEGRFPLHFSVPTDHHNHAVTVTTELSLGQWYHIAAVYDDAARKAMLYVDGQLAASVDAASCAGRGTGFSLASFGPDVFRVDHIVRLTGAFIDAVAFSDEPLAAGSFAVGG